MSNHRPKSWILKLVEMYPISWRYKTLNKLTNRCKIAQSWFKSSVVRKGGHRPQLYRSSPTPSTILTLITIDTNRLKSQARTSSLRNRTAGSTTKSKNQIGKNNRVHFQGLISRIGTKSWTRQHSESQATILIFPKKDVFNMSIIYAKRRVRERRNSPQALSTNKIKWLNPIVMKWYQLVT